MPLSQIDIERYFSNCPVDIIKNSRLREPQLKGYIAALRYFRENPNGHALLILPVGSGKSGLRATLTHMTRRLSLRQCWGYQRRFQSPSWTLPILVKTAFALNPF